MKKHGGITTLSFDVFDTLLLRNTKHELYRYYEICERFKQLIDLHLKTDIDIDDIYISRLTAFKACYRSVTPKCGVREGRLESVLVLMMKILNLAPDSIEEILPLLIEAEVEYETENLAVNPVLNCLFHNDMADDLDIIFVSDMYLPVSLIRKLVYHFYPNLSLKASYSSADLSITKSSGLLYEFVLKDLGLNRKEILHVGDNLKSDVEMARRRGISALHLPIPDDKLAEKKIKKKQFERWLAERGFELELFW